MKLHSRTVQSFQSEQLDTIWSIVEARKTFPAMIVVVGATDADDTASIARGLAEAACASGQNAAYLQLTTRGSASAGSGPYAELSIAQRSSKREAFDSALEVWRGMYDVIIVDIANVRSEPVAAHVARIAEGVVIGICAKRRVVAADRELASLLKQLQAALIGVVLSVPFERTAAVGETRDRSRLATASQR